jgi:hypothetical protein
MNEERQKMNSEETLVGVTIQWKWVGIVVMGNCQLIAIRHHHHGYQYQDTNMDMIVLSLMVTMDSI